MKDVHDANISFWSPQPYFIGAFFFLQQIFQLVWLYRLYKSDPKKSEKDKKEVEIIVDFVPFYIVGNLCIASELLISISNTGYEYSADENSLDDILELFSAQNKQCLRPHQLLIPNILHLPPPTPHEHLIHLLDPHARCFKDFCWYRCSRSLAQRIRGIL